MAPGRLNGPSRANNLRGQASDTGVEKKGRIPSQTSSFVVRIYAGFLFRRLVIRITLERVETKRPERESF